MGSADLRVGGGFARSLIDLLAVERRRADLGARVLGPARPPHPVAGTSRALFLFDCVICICRARRTRSREKPGCRARNPCKLVDACTSPPQEQNDADHDQRLASQ